MNILITGGTGFIGSHLVEYFLNKYEDCVITILDRLDFTSSMKRLDHLKTNRLRFIWHDLKSSSFPVELKRYAFTHILHLAASSHVDRSIIDPLSFVMDNVVGTCNLLEFYRHFQRQAQLIYFSTDEVFGPAMYPDYHGLGAPSLQTEYGEWDRYNSTNPYAASKAGAEELCLAYANTYSLNIKITHCMNVIGERQHPEKFIPMCIKKIQAGETIQIHSSPEGIPGSRYYIHAYDVCRAIDTIKDCKAPRAKYNISGNEEVSNQAIAEIIGACLGIKPITEAIDFHSSRPGHDLRYALSSAKLKRIGWKQELTVKDALNQIVDFYIDNPEWLEC